MTESTLFTPADAATAHEVRQWLAHGRRLLWFNRLMAALLVGTAAWMLRA